MLHYLLLLLLTILPVSCAPMEYKDLGTEMSPSLSFDRDEYVLEAEDNGEEIEIRFEAIPYAASYGYGLESGDILKFTEDELKFSDGYYTASISKSSSIFTPASSALRKTSAGRVSIIIFASVKTSPDNDWVIVKSADVELQLKTAPSLSYSARTENSIVLENREGAVSGITYSVSADGRVLAEFTSDKLPFTLDNLGPEAISLTIAHKYTGTESYAEALQTLDIPEYDMRQSDILIAAGSDNTITVSNLPEGEYSAIGLYSVLADGTMNEISRIAYDGTGGERVFPSSVFGDGYFIADIRAAVYKDTVNDEDALLSEVVSYERDIERRSERIGRQSYSVLIPLSPLLGLTEENISVSGASSSFLMTEEGIEITSSPRSLVSRTDYTITLTLSVPSYGKVVKKIEFRTDSFKGEYIWTASGSGGARQFAVLVEEAPATARCNYYVFTSPSDIAFENDVYKKLRINPLYENDSDLPSGGVSYGNAPEAYRWNNEKWNSSDNKPDKLTSISTTIISKDHVSADVGSKAMGFSVVTTSSTEFIEKDDGTCLMVFYNEMTDGSSIAVSMGNKALLKNTAPKSENFEESGYHYALLLQEI